MSQNGQTHFKNPIAFSATMLYNGLTALNFTWEMKSGVKKSNTN